MRVLQVLTQVCLATLATCLHSPSFSSRRRLRLRDHPPREEVHRSKGATNKYILETRPGIGIGSIAKQTSSFRGRNNNTTTFHHEFDCSDIFSGLVIETHHDNVDTLRALEGVVNVWPMNAVPLMPAPGSSEAPSPPIPRGNNSIHRWTGVDKLHAQGLRGKGATVAVIDTGVDYNHKALGGCFGPGCKISGGYDLVGPTWNTHQETLFPKAPDGDPLDSYGHGTHVVGIVAGEAEDFLGVAPDANILIYKVFADDAEDTDEEVLIQSFCDAYSSGADIITSSIGRPDGFTDNPWALVASRLVEKGVVVVISAGNEGYTGPIYANSGSSGAGVLAVAAVNVSSSLNVSTADPEAPPMAAYFTSWGPTNELLLKPEIAAPGYRIYSTYLDQSFKELSGTSMSAPYVAGVAALYIGKHGGRELHGPGIARAIGHRIAASGQNVAWSADRVRLNRTAPPVQVGTGLVDAWKVVNYDTQLAGEPLSLGDTEMFKPDWTVNITNNGNSTVTYSFELEPQPGVEILDTYYGIQTLFDLVPKRIVPDVALPRQLTIGPGQSSRAEFRFQPPDISDERLPLYSGKISIKGDNGERLSIPYGGVAYDTEKEFDTMFTRKPYVNEYKNDWAWTFNVDAAPYDFVELTARLRYPCSHLRWDIFVKYWDERNWQLPSGRPGQNDDDDYIGSATTFRDSDAFWSFDPSRMDKEDTVPFPLMRVPRGYANFWWFGKLANGSYIRPGNYSMRFAALRPYGNPNISDHWDTMAVEPIRFQVLPNNGSTNVTRAMSHRLF